MGQTLVPRIFPKSPQTTLALAHSKNKCFATKRGTSPFALFQVISSQDSIPEKLPEEDFNFERNFCLPNPFVMRTSQISLEVLIH
jgi:hypothetical protein